MWTGFWGCAGGGAHRNNSCLHMRWWSGSPDRAIPLSQNKGEKLPEGGADLKVEWFSSGAGAFTRLEVHPKPCLSSLSSFLVLHSTPLSLFGADLGCLLEFSYRNSHSLLMCLGSGRRGYIESLAGFLFFIQLSIFHLSFWTEEERQSSGGRGLDCLSLQAQGGSASWCVEMGGTLAQRSEDQI